MKRILLGMIIITFFLASCGVKQEVNNTEPAEYKEANIVDEETEGDFIYRLVSEKVEYGKEEKVKIYAELEYIGDSDEMVIFHAASPFYFPMIEKTRNYEIDYPMNQPLVSTTVKKGQPIRQEYVKSGGYSSEDPEEYVKFMKSFLEEGFPTGHYIVNGFVNFFTENEDDTQNDLTINGQVEFEVQ